MSRFYAPQLDGLRFCAALLVLFNHGPRVPGLGFFKDYGGLGVDLFLAISAFLITRLLVLEHERTGDIRLKSFYIRRALRIWPLYFTYVAAACLLTLLLGRLPWDQVIGWWLSHLSLSHNLLTAFKGWDGQPLFTNHLWTISLEEQAYLVIPVLVTLAVGRNPAWLLRIAIGILCALIVARLAFTLIRVPFPAIWVLPLRGDAFLFGGLAGLLWGKFRAGPWMLPVGVALFATASFFPPADHPSLFQVFGYTFVALGCALIVVGAVSLEGGFLASRPMRYLGKTSYGFYVFHLLALDLAIGRVRDLGANEVWAVPLAALIAVIMAGMSYRWLETPFLRLKRRFELVQSRPI